ncbi:hypothetical protein HDV02_004105 [Globomyces sp. JEL0801]|nr:hypothetical protein HDV02_004105 [Globomyces sp. JEL0801]
MEYHPDVLQAFVDLKKKKKRVAQESKPKVEVVDYHNEFNEQVVNEPTPEPVIVEDPQAMFGDLKKKKKKKVIDFDQVDAPVENVEINETSEVAHVDAIDKDTLAINASMFGKKKKKKDKKMDMADFEAEIRADEGEDTFGTTAKKAEKEDDAWGLSTRDYTYQELLTRVFNILHQNNPEIQGEKKRYTIVPPQVLREGTKKTAFANIIDISKRMRRQPDHVIQFLFAELGTSGSMDGNQRLVIKGRFQQKQIETVLKRYIVEYVSCKTCKSAETILTKENRLFFLQCESCGSSRSVAAIKTGFMATVKRTKKEA